MYEVGEIQCSDILTCFVEEFSPFVFIISLLLMGLWRKHFPPFSLSCTLFEWITGREISIIRQKIMKWIVYMLHQSGMLLAAGNRG